MKKKSLPFKRECARLICAKTATKEVRFGSRYLHLCAGCAKEMLNWAGKRYDHKPIQSGKRA